MFCALSHGWTNNPELPFIISDVPPDFAGGHCGGGVASAVIEGRGAMTAPPIASGGREINPAVAELAAIPRWVNWRLERSPSGKLTKVPYVIGCRRKASCTNPRTWDSFDACWRSAFIDGAAAGIGIVLDGSDDLMAADLDDCIFQSGIVKPAARIVVRKLDSYTERSPSGRGLRVFFRGTMPDKGRKVRYQDGHLELYRTERYLTVTGSHLEETPETINYVAPEVIAELLGRSQSTSGVKNGPDPIPAGEVSDDLRDRLNEAMAHSSAVWEAWNGQAPDGNDRTRSAFDLKLAGALRRHGGFSLEDFATLARWWPHGKGKEGDPRHWRRTWERAAPKAGRAAAEPETMTMAELLGMDFAPVKWVVPDVLCEGLTIKAGRPKLGKSWAVLDWAIAVSGDRPAFGSVDCETGDVLFIALEDSKRRLRSRLQKLGANPNERLKLCVEWPRIDEGGIEAIKAWLDKHPDARLIVIDTLAKIRPKGISNKDAYQADADALTELHKLANARAVAIVVVHHTRKAAADDWLDSVAGTTGLTGVADSTLVLKRERGQADAFLLGTGRDLPDYELPLKFDEQTCRWQKLDMSAAEAHATSDQAAVLRVLREACGACLMRSQIAAMTGRSKEATSNMLSRMEAAGLVEPRGNLWHPTV